MTLISTIISDAFREGNLTAVGSSPSTAEQDEALRLINRNISGLFGREAGEDLVDVAVGKGNVDRSKKIPLFLEDYPEECIPENARLVLNLQQATTLALPAAPMNGAKFSVTDASNNLATYNLTILGNGRMIESANSLTLNTNGLDRTWFYRGDLADWKKLTDLTLTDESPFPEKYDDLLVIGLAIRINPRNGVSVDEQSMMQYSKLRSQFQAEYRQRREEPVELALLKLGKDTRWGYDSNIEFNLGRPGWLPR